MYMQKHFGDCLTSADIKSFWRFVFCFHVWCWYGGFIIARLGLLAWLFLLRIKIFVVLMLLHCARLSGIARRLQEKNLSQWKVSLSVHGCSPELPNFYLWDCFIPWLVMLRHCWTVNNHHCQNQINFL